MSGEYGGRSKTGSPVSSIKINCTTLLTWCMVALSSMTTLLELAIGKIAGQWDAPKNISTANAQHLQLGLLAITEPCVAHPHQQATVRIFASDPSSFYHVCYVLIPSLSLFHCLHVSFPLCVQILSLHLFSIFHHTLSCTIMHHEFIQSCFQFCLTAADEGLRVEHSALSFLTVLREVD